MIPHAEFPAYCIIKVSFDGHNFIQYYDTFLIYSATMKIAGIEPKCGPADGAIKLQVNMNLDNIPGKYLTALTIGFQPKMRKISTNISRTVTNELEDSKNDEMSNNNTYIHETNKKDSSLQTNVHQVDLTTQDAILEKTNWYCSNAFYDNKIVTCNVPKIDKFSQNQVEYYVDIAINGIQFTGFPMIYRFYEIKIEKMEPNISQIEGGLSIKIMGTGLFDSVSKKARISSSFDVRYSDLQWERSDKSLSLTSHPLLWSIDEEVLKSLQTNPKDLYEKYVFDVAITMNNIDWIQVGQYRYCDCKVNRISYINFSDKLTTLLDVLL
jgi:hypothetical protein